MTKLERKEEQLEKLYGYREAASRRNDFMWINMNAAKIDALEKEIIEMRREQSSTVFRTLLDKDEATKKEVYRALLRISLLADACNEACVVAYDMLRKYGVTGFSYQDKVKDLCDRSRHIANITLRANDKKLEDMIVDNETFVDMCIKHADAHLKRKLKL